ncbi:hypothetical protein PUND_b0495 [Pseudoalteromonas undina]|jgi:hypothetical protein|uniref:Uncharacterized protein n=1 Tax=Pseudoalteromonas undina TaxID=43660 RepID=A0ABN0NIR9_9GAMM|nr:DUF5992 family protein [Pseudoalteromonas undina]KAF7763155.1 hypothetical protein PUND_b0495 [Pseudoalteromonas undina]
MFIRVLIFFGFLIVSTPVFCGELVRGATVTEVASSSSNMDVFYLKLSGGTGPCANSSVIFPAIKSQSKESYNQAFSIALAAVSSGKKIRVHNYEDDSCHGANFIGISSS